MIGDILCSLAKAFGAKCPQLICPEPEPVPTDFPIVYESWSNIRQELANLGIKPMENSADMPDSYFYYTDEEHWKEIIKYLTFSAELYVWYERRDCDDYSKKASADSNWLFGLNTIQMWGNTPYEYHAFNAIRTENGWKLFEPNAGFEAAGELLEFNNQYGWTPAKYKS